ncbi:MAG: acyltransferase [Planctomycetota bacterium]
MTATLETGRATDQGGDRLGVINGLRGLAILSVFCYHLFSRFTMPGKLEWATFGLDLKISDPTNNGWMGVNIFFVLSGFVLLLPYARGSRAMASPADTRGFYRRRFQRLMPLYYFGVLICAVFVWHPQPGSAEFFSDLFFMGTGTFNFVEDLYYPPYNWVLWSLGLEIWFSVLFPLLVRLYLRFGIGRLLLSVMALSLATRIFGEFHYGGAFHQDPHLDPIKDSFIGRLDEFVLGMALCHLYVKRGALSAPLARISCLLGAAGLYSACWYYDRLWTGELSRNAVPFLYYLISLGTFALAYGLLSLRRGALHLVFTCAPLQWLGMICYSLYFWHGVLILFLFKEPGHYDLIPLFANIAVILTVAALSYRYVEYGWKRETRELFRPAP